MKKKMFILTEAVLAAMVLTLAFLMLQGKNDKDRDKISVIIQKSDDSRWVAFKYGLKMAAEDQKIEVSVVCTEDLFTGTEEKNIIQNEIDYGADAIIIQPAGGYDSEKMLKKFQKKIPVMLVECTASKERGDSVMPSVEADNYAMGAALAEELLKDCGGKIEGKTIGIFSKTEQWEAVVDRSRGFRDTMKDTGAKISWSVFDSMAEDGEEVLRIQGKVDFVVALDDSSMTIAQECALNNNLRGALVYGIGNSTEAVYYLDVGFAECLIVPDEFNVGYQSVTEVAQKLRNPFYEMKNRTVTYKVLRRDTLFSEENQELLFTMSQ